MGWRCALNSKFLVAGSFRFESCSSVYSFDQEGTPTKRDVDDWHLKIKTLKSGTDVSIKRNQWIWKQFKDKLKRWEYFSYVFVRASDSKRWHNSLTTYDVFVLQRRAIRATVALSCWRVTGVTITNLMIPPSSREWVPHQYRQKYRDTLKYTNDEGLKFLAVSIMPSNNRR